MGYPPGLRENGGQYTHGSLWMAMAWARFGDGGRAAGSPHPDESHRAGREHRTMSSGIAASLMRPQPMCPPPRDARAGADGPGTPGRLHGCIASGSKRSWDSNCAGTSCAWSPCCRQIGPDSSLSTGYQSSTYQIEVQRDAPLDTIHVTLDGQPADGKEIRLADDGLVHQVLVRVPKPLQRLLPPGDRPIDRHPAVGLAESIV